jgi:hypothetical protein
LIKQQASTSEIGVKTMKTCISMTTAITMILGFGLVSPTMAMISNNTDLESLSVAQVETSSQKLIPVAENNSYPQCKDKCDAKGRQGAGTR